MAQKKPTKLQQLIQIIVSRTAPITRLRLAKLIYLIDWEHYKRTRDSLSAAYYLREQKGPLPATLGTDLSRMQPYEILTSPGRTDSMHRPGKRPRFQPLLSPEELETVSHVLGKYGKYSERDLLLAVYATEPMKALLREERAGALRRHQPVYMKKYAPITPHQPRPARSLQDLTTEYSAVAERLPTLADQHLSNEDIRLILEAYKRSLPLIKTAEEILATWLAEGGDDGETD